VVKKRVKFGKKTCGLNVEKLTTVQKTFVLQLWPPANVRELIRAHANGAWLKSRRAYNVRELSQQRDLTHAGVQHEYMLGASKNCKGESKNLIYLIRLLKEAKFGVNPSFFSERNSTFSLSSFSLLLIQDGWF